MRSFVCVALIALVAVSSVYADEPAPVKLEGPTVGIDLGTTYSCVGTYKNGRVEIIPNEQGNRITPSVVAFTEEGERIIGDGAKNQASLNPSNTVFDVKRFIGRRFAEPTVQSDKKLLPFDIVDKEGRPFIEVSVKGEKKQFAPEELSSMVLTKMRDIAEKYLGESVKHAVITVPAYFNDSQRQSTKDAGVISGLNVLRIINEPTAAAIAYGLDRNNDDTKILVFDLGGGTFDVSVLTLDQGVFEVMATNGDTHLGGEDFDQRVMNWVVETVQKKHNVDLSGNKRALAKIRREAERAKRVLSTDFETKIEIDGLVDGDDFSETLTRAKFEELNVDLFKKTLKPVANVLKDAGLKKTDIQEVILVGGSTRIPYVQQILSKFFDGKALNKQVNPDEAVAFGAAVQAGILSGQGGDNTKNLLLLDVTPLTIGIELIGGEMMRFIERNSVVPAKKIKSVTTTADYQTTIPIRVYQGERPRTKDNVLLGEFDLEGLIPAKKGTPDVEVTFNIDANGILNVAAQDKATKKSNAVTINADRGKLSEEQLAKMMEDAEKYADADKAWLQAKEAKQDFENYVYQIKSMADAQKGGTKLNVSDLRKLTSKIDEAEQLLEAKLEDEENTKEKWDDAKTNLQSFCDPFVNKLYGKKGDSHDEL